MGKQVRKQTHAKEVTQAMPVEPAPADPVPTTGETPDSDDSSASTSGASTVSLTSGVFVSGSSCRESTSSDSWGVERMSPGIPPVTKLAVNSLCLFNKTLIRSYGELRVKIYLQIK